jgi:hypothetical protein
VTVPLPLLPVVAAGADVGAAVVLDVVELLELAVASELEMLSAVVEAFEALPAYDAAAT